MAEHAAGLILEGVPIAAEHYEKVYDPLKNKTKQGVQKIKKMRNGRSYDEESDYEEDYDGPPRRSQTDRTRSPRDSDRRRSRRGDLVEERYAYKGSGRARSMGRDGYGSRGIGRDRSRKGSRRDYSDSESSLSPPRRERRKSLGGKALAVLGIGGAAAAADKSSRRRSYSRSPSPPRDRGGRRRRSYDRDYDRRDTRDRGPPSRGYDDDDRTPSRYKPAGYIGNGGDSERGGGGGEVARRNNNDQVGPRNGGGGSGKKKGSSSSDDESSSVCSSSEDERRTRKMKGKEYLTAGLAAVATIHAAHSVYQSMEKRDQRHLEVLQGEMTPEEAKKKKNKARLQDAAAIGIAALGIKGAYSEWQEVQEHRKELGEVQDERQKHHEKRLKKLSKSGGSSQGGSQYGGRNRSEPPRRGGDRYRDRSR